MQYYWGSKWQQGLKLTVITGFSSISELDVETVEMPGKQEIKLLPAVCFV